MPHCLSLTGGRPMFTLRAWRSWPRSTEKCRAMKSTGNVALPCSGLPPSSPSMKAAGATRWLQLRDDRHLAQVGTGMRSARSGARTTLGLRREWRRSPRRRRTSIDRQGRSRSGWMAIHGLQPRHDHRARTAWQPRGLGARAGWHPLGRVRPADERTSPGCRNRWSG